MADTKSQRDVYIVDGARTPFLKMRNEPNPFSATDLAVACGKELLSRQPFPPSAVGEVILGCVMPRENEANIARVVALRLGCGDSVPAWTVQRNCGSGMQSLDSAMKDIQLGHYDLVLAGGTEAMSHAPLIYSKDYVKWLSRLAGSKSLQQKAASLIKFRPQYLVPEVALRTGLSDPIVGLSMGQTAEKLAHEFNISRSEMDEFAMESHQRVIKAAADGKLANITTLYDTAGHFYDGDTGVRADTSLEKLSQLKPFFDRFGSVTAGNSSQVTDGAALLLLASETAVQKYKLPTLGKIVAANWAALAPDVMGLGPIYAATPLLQKQNLDINAIDYWEINEAFAAQVLACRKAWSEDEFCRERLGLDRAFGEVPMDRLNISGGAIALGHPVGASGARIVWQLMSTLLQKQAKRGMAMICIGGGQGGAMLIERTEGVK